MLLNTCLSNIWWSVLCDWTCLSTYRDFIDFSRHLYAWEMTEVNIHCIVLLWKQVHMILFMLGKWCIVLENRLNFHWTRMSISTSTFSLSLLRRFILVKLADWLTNFVGYEESWALCDHQSQWIVITLAIRSICMHMINQIMMRTDHNWCCIPYFDFIVSFQ
jgi:hypothetical protein